MRTLRSLITLLSVSSLAACAAPQPEERRWTFEQLLAPPTGAEVQRVDREWERKKWSVRDIRPAGVTTVPIGKEEFEARLFRFTLNGSQRCGAVLLPRGAAARSLAGLVDIGDIRWDYPDRNLTKGPYVANILGDIASRVGLIVPCTRGVGLRIGDLRVEAAGDRRDAWEGTAEDAIGFLTAALGVTPEIDPSRLGVYGYSRGGGVALIVGERDPRIRAVLAFAAPTDWFSAMARPGENWAARLAEASGDSALRPDTRENQFLDFFVRGRETLPLPQVRRKLIASSPFYFTARLPAVQAHFGERDVAVPLPNATSLKERLSTHDKAHDVFIYQDAGHMLDETGAWKTAREFLREQLATPDE